MAGTQCCTFQLGLVFTAVACLSDLLAELVILAGQERATPAPEVRGEAADGVIGQPNNHVGADRGSRAERLCLAVVQERQW